MKKHELISKVAEATGHSQRIVKEVFEKSFEVLSDVIVAKDSFTILGFGTFGAAERKARTAINLHTGKKIAVPAKTAPRIKFSAALREKVASGKKAKKK
jgi:DNA-binding protein HU homolog